MCVCVCIASAEQVSDECSGDYKHFLVAMLQSPVEVDAHWL